MMSKHIYEIIQESDVKIENNRYLFIINDSSDSIGDYELYEKVDNLFLIYDTYSNTEVKTNYLYATGTYHAFCKKDETGRYEHMIICDSITHHSKFEIQAIKNQLNQ